MLTLCCVVSAVVKRQVESIFSSALPWKIRQKATDGCQTEDNVDKKMNLYFTYEFWDTLKSLNHLLCLYCQSYHKNESGTLR